MGHGSSSSVRNALRRDDCAIAILLKDTLEFNMQGIEFPSDDLSKDFLKLIHRVGELWLWCRFGLMKSNRLCTAVSAYVLSSHWKVQMLRLGNLRYSTSNYLPRAQDWSRYSSNYHPIYSRLHRSSAELRRLKGKGGSTSIPLVQTTSSSNHCIASKRTNLESRALRLVVWTN